MKTIHLKGITNPMSESEMKKKVLFVYFLSCIFLVLLSCKEDKTNVILLDLGTSNCDYGELVLGIRYHQNPNPVYFNGITEGDFWTFCYPDTLYDKSFDFSIQETTHIDTLLRYVGFKYICNKDTFWAISLSIANKDTTVINATYLQTDTFQNVLKIDKNGNMIFVTQLNDLYLLTSDQDKELLSALEVTKSGFFWYDVDSSKYDTELDEYMDLVRKYPNSHSLIEKLYSRSYIFKSKNDIQKVFDCFSVENKNSFYGKRVNQYLTDNYFKNSILKSWDTGENEAIIIDSAKHNLIIFSASWCIPCIEKIPVLKNIYEDLSDNLDMVYVSIDHSKTVEEWRQLMRKENIPWRSVLAEDDVDGIIEKYHVWGVPYCLFVHPDGLMEPIDVRNAPELNYLYKTVQEEK